MTTERKQGHLRYRCPVCTNTYDWPLVASVLSVPKSVMVWYGGWPIDETNQIRKIIDRNTYIPIIHEWSFYKGRHIMTAWKREHRSGFVISAKTIDELIAKIKEYYDAMCVEYST